MPRFALSHSRSLRPLRESDAQELHAVIAANRSHLARWMPWAEDQTLEQTLAFIRTTRKQQADNNGFQAALLDERRIIGVVGFHDVDWPNGTTSIGYWLAQSEQGRGAMTEAVRALVDHALRGWGLNRVEIRAEVENLRSRAIPERLGFREEGTLRQAVRWGDRFLDHVVYSMLAEEWCAP